MKIKINTVANGDHVPEIKRLNSTIKERVRVLYNDLKSQFTKFIGVLTREMIHVTVFCINSFPAVYLISNTISPQ